MKRILAAMLSLVLLLSLSAAALGAEAKVQRSSQNLTVDGAAVACAAYNIDGYNYVKLRALAALLADTSCRFDLSYDKAANTVSIIRGTAYTGAAETDGGADESDSAVPSAQTIVVDGVQRDGLSVWNIGGSNWFRLAELSGLLGFTLRYDAESRTAQIETGAAAAAHPDSYADVLAAFGSIRGGMRTDGARATNAGAITTELAEDAEMPAAVPAADAAKGVDEAAYSGTNVQVEGIDEGDIVKTDGKYLYVLRGRLLTILRADGADTAVVSETEIGHYSYEDGKNAKTGYSSESKDPREMFIGDGVLCVVSNYYSYSSGEVDGEWHYENKQYTCVDLYNVSDPAAPTLTVTLGQDGCILGTRMQGGKVYLVTNHWVWNYDEDDPGTYVPVLYRNGEARILPVGDIYICPGCSSTEYVVACEYDLTSGECTASRTLLGGGDTIYMNADSLYVMGSRWEDTVTDQYTESVYTVEEHREASVTEIWRFDLTDGLEMSANGRIPGSLESQFSADAYNGYLRLVTTRNDSSYRIYTDEAYEFTNYQWDDRTQTTGLYVLDGELSVVGKVDDLAPDERVYSARFDGDIAYFCTFRNVDPLFAVDVSDPAAPKVLSALKISGFSEYLHPWAEGRLFGFGREADEETGWSEQLKLVMFNTENKADVTVKHTLLLDDCWYSEALYDHKAFFIDGVKNIIGFVGDSDYYIYSYDDAAGFRPLCHFEYDTWPGSVRGFWIGDCAYIVGENVVQVLSLDGWDRLLTLKLAADDPDLPVMPYIKAE